MAELLNAIESWQSLLLALAMFGTAPGLCLRLIVLAYPRSDPRRAELIAELYAVPRWERPFWAAEQLEVALFEGLGQRRRDRRGGGEPREGPDEPPAQDLERFVGLF
ncbi:MAG: hypothetical protein ACRDRI_12355 [Pseudonocardiaceae bacterium]